MKIPLTIVALLVVAAICRAQSDSIPRIEISESTSTVQFTLTKEVDLEFASAGYPIRVHLVQTSDLARQLEIALQELGFSFNPQQPKQTIADCEEISKRVDAKKKVCNFFWTDYVPLDQQLIEKIGTDWSTLRLAKTDELHYQIKVVGCWWPTTELYSDDEDPNSTYEQGLMEQWVTSREPLSDIVVLDGDTLRLKSPFKTLTPSVRSLDSLVVLRPKREAFESLWPVKHTAPVELTAMISVFVEKRGSKGAFVPVKANYSPSPISNWILSTAKKNVARLENRFEIDYFDFDYAIMGDLPKIFQDLNSAPPPELQ